MQVQPMVGTHTIDRVLEIVYHVNELAKSGIVGRALDWGSRGCQLEPHHQWSNCCVLEQDTLSAT